MHLFLHIFQNISCYFWKIAWTIKANNFPKAKVQPQGIQLSFCWSFYQFLLGIVYNSVAFKKACIWLVSLKTRYCYKLCFSFSCLGYDLILIRKRDTFNYDLFLLKHNLTNSLCVTVIAQFTTKTTNSEKAIYFVSLMSFAINKLKSHIIFTRKNFTWKKTFAPGNGGGQRSSASLSPFPYGPVDQ